MISERQSELHDRISEYIKAGEVSLADIENWLWSFIDGLEDGEDNEALRVAGRIGSIISECSYGDRPEDSVREDLAAAIRPFDPPSTSNIALVPAGLQFSWKFDQPIIHRTSESDNSLLFLGSDAPIVYIDFSPQSAFREWLNVVVGRTFAWGTAGSANNNSALPEREPPQMETAPWRAASMYSEAPALVQS